MGLPGLTGSRRESDGLRVFGHRVDSARTLLVLVHGFRGNRETTWGQTPRLLLDIPQRTFDVAIYQYPSRFFPVGLVGVDGQAEALVQEIEDQAKAHGYSQVGLAGHSMGGLIVSLAATLLLGRILSDSPNKGAPPVLSGLLCVGTPWEGVTIAGLASPWHLQLRDLSRGGVGVRERARGGFENAEAKGIWAHNLVAMRDGIVAPQPVETALRRYWIKTTHTGAVAAKSAQDDRFAPFHEWALRASQASLLTYLRDLRRRVDDLGIRPISEEHGRVLFENRSATEWEASEGDGVSPAGRQIIPDLLGSRTERDRLPEVVSELLHSSEERVGLTGEGGAGKTTVLIELAREAVAAAIKQPGRSPVPLLVRLRYLGESAPRSNRVHEAVQAIVDAVEAGPQASAWMEESVTNGVRPPLLVLVDGLDEGGRAQIGLVEDLGRLLVPGDRMVAAGRPEAIFRTRSFKTYRLDPLTREQATRIAERQLGSSEAAKFRSWVEEADPSFAAKPGQLEMLLRMWYGEPREAKPAPWCVGELYHRALPYMFGRERDPGATVIRLSSEDLNGLARRSEECLPRLAFRRFVFGEQPDLTALDGGFLQHLQSSGIVEQRSYTALKQSWHFASARWQEYFASLELRRVVQSGEAIDGKAITPPSLLNIWRMATTDDESGRVVVQAAGNLSPVLHAVVLAALGAMDAVDVTLGLVRKGGTGAGVIPGLLRGTPGRTAVVALSAILSDPKTPEEVRRRAVFSLRGTQDPEAAGGLVALLKDPDTPEQVRWQAVTSLQGTQDPEALGVLGAALKDLDIPEQVRWYAALSLEGTQDPEALGSLVAQLKNPDSPEQVRWGAAFSLVGTREPEALGALVAALKDPETPDAVRRRAAFSLVGTQDPEALGSLVALLKDPNAPEQVRWRAASGLKGTQDPEALGALVAAFKDPNTPKGVTFQAAVSLKGTHNPEALWALVALLKEPITPEETRWQAGYALSHAGPRTAVAQALLSGRNVQTDGLVHRVIANRLVPDDVSIIEWPK